MGPFHQFHSTLLFPFCEHFQCGDCNVFLQSPKVFLLISQCVPAGDYQSPRLMHLGAAGEEGYLLMEYKDIIRQAWLYDRSRSSKQEFEPKNI